MRKFTPLFFACGVALVVAAVGWWNTREASAPTLAEPARATAIVPVEPIATKAQLPVQPTAAPAAVAESDDMPTTAEIDDMAARFAAQPALIDALEDAAPENDARVRNDAEQLLRQLVPPEQTTTP
jgi:hypothetical protein